MPVTPRLRRRAAAALPALLAVVLTACQTDYPNSVFTAHTDFNRDVGYLFRILIYLGTAVFLFVEGILLYTIFRYRRRSESDRPEHVHGNTTLEVLWTVIPAIVLAFIAVPTVQTIFRTQAKARTDALQIEVIGHQWWWEFRYPQYKVTTANELYLPIGRTANFALRTEDVLHSFWIPQMGGKRDLITNRTNWLWFTPDSVSSQAWNGFCVEYCGTSHANMHFRMFTVAPADFDAWIRHQQRPAVFGAVGGAGTAVDSAVPGAAVPAATVQQAGFVAFPREKIPAHVVPQTPLPAGLPYDDALTGDPMRGRDLLTKGAGGCLGCHVISGNPSMVGTVGPNLTHLGSRSTIAGGIFPNDSRHLARWIKNARLMKPGVIMPTIGAGQYDPVTKNTVPRTGGLTDEQIADIVAYLQALK